jgi:hypothetical protein
MQLALEDCGPSPITRASARQQAYAASIARRDRGMAQSESSAESSCAGWIKLAVDRVRAFASTQTGVFTIEQLRSVVGPELPPVPELRAWGQVTVQAARLGYIERVPKVFLPAASSNSSPKPAWRKKRPAGASNE